MLDTFAELSKLSQDELDLIARQVNEALPSLNWIPSPGPQLQAYLSQADILMYGGQAGGGKTDLLLGLAFTHHRRSLLLRRQYTDLSGLTDRAIELNGSKKGYNGAPPPRFHLSDGRMIDFGAAATPGDEEHWQGRPHDFIGFDEGVQFLESQFRYLMGWNRTPDKQQRCRVVVASNPPISAEGVWVIQFFAPWLDETHPNPAMPGELRWFIVDEDGKDREVDGPEPVKIGKRKYRPLSRTFIPSSLEDNPFLKDTNYAAQLDAMPEPMRSAFRDGNFMAARQDDAFQCIPTKWIMDAQARWKPEPPDGAPMSAMGVDVAAGGPDNTVLALRYDYWFDRIISVPGRDTPEGQDVAALIVKYRRHSATVIIDMGGGYGGAPKEHLKGNGVTAVAYKGSAKSSARTIDRTYPFFNKRTEAYWRFREALDPSQEGGSKIALPPDPILRADLAAPTFRVNSSGIQLVSKEKLVEKLGRSPDRGDAVIMAWSAGPTSMTHGQIWRNAISNVIAPKIFRGHDSKRRRK